MLEFFRVMFGYQFMVRALVVGALVSLCAALLGVTGAVVKAHGSSKAHAYACAIRQARTMVEGKVVDIIAGQLSAAAGDAAK